MRWNRFLSRSAPAASSPDAEKAGSLFRDTPWTTRDLAVGLCLWGVLAAASFLSAGRWLQGLAYPLRTAITESFMFAVMLGYPLAVAARRGGRGALRPPEPVLVILEILIAAGITLCALVMLIGALHLWQSVTGHPFGDENSVRSLAERFTERDLHLFAVAAILLGPICEEIFFRGFLFNIFHRYCPLGVAIVVQAALFAVAHHYQLASATLTFCLGVLLALVYQWRRTLVTAIAVHGIYNGIAVLSVAVIMASPVLGVVENPEVKDRLVVGRVLPGSGAEKAGIAVGDVIESIAGKPVASLNELSAEVLKRKAGDVVDVAIVRDGKPIEKQVTLGRRAPAAGATQLREKESRK